MADQKVTQVYTKTVALLESQTEKKQQKIMGFLEEKNDIEMSQKTLKQIEK